MHKSRWCIGVRSSAGRELYKKFLLSIVKLVSLIKHALGIRRRRGSKQIPRRWARSKTRSYLQSRSYTRANVRVLMHCSSPVTFPLATELILLHFPLLIARYRDKTTGNVRLLCKRQRRMKWLRIEWLHHEIVSCPNS